MKGTDAGQAEGMLEAFGLRYMPNAYAHYQEVRGAALELEQTLADNFPQGKASDPTGGELYGKVTRGVMAAVAEMDRRHDELCFFLLFHRAGMFSESLLGKYDERKISVRLARESPEWPDDTPRRAVGLAAADVTFAEKYMPETLAGRQRLSSLFIDGAKQYSDLRQTALALDATRARRELAVFRERLTEIRGKVDELNKAFPVWRMRHAVGDATSADLEKLDHETAASIQIVEKGWEAKTYVAAHCRVPAKAGETKVVTLPGGATMEMVWCPEGSFAMGSRNGDSDERPVHEVTLSGGFWMAKTEVTQAQWKSVMGNNPSHHEGDNLPVENVSPFDCQEFCKKTGLSLPTEVEWEYAYRAGTTGDYGGTGRPMWWSDLDRAERTHPVGQKGPNAWGLYDMHGNVWEWCVDRDGDYPSGAVTDPTGAGSGPVCVVRGGCYGDYASDFRSVIRSGRYPGYWSFGFRPVDRLD